MTKTRRLGMALVLAAAVVAMGPAASVQAAPRDKVNMAVSWNQTMLTAFAAANVAPPAANRLGAVVQAAVFDAVNGIDRRYTPIHVQPAAPDEASPDAAAASAAHEALVKLFPTQSTSLDAALATSVQSLADDDDAQAISDGLAWGKTVADAVLLWRSTDGFSATPPSYVFSTAPGQWQPTPGPNTGPPRFRTLATTTPFVLASPSQFRPAGPPALASARYARDFNEVKSVGSVNSTTRSAYETETAVFWQVDTPVAMWDRVADSLAVARHLNLVRTVRLLALVNLSIGDAIIAVFEAKNTFNSWRPVTAIVNGGLDGNPDTAPEAGWQSLLVAPYFQEYPSAHSGTSSAAAVALASVFGDETSFTVTSAGLPGVTRSFTTFSAGAAQVGDARVLAGIHFRSACDDGIAMGASIATYVNTHAMLRAGEKED